MESGTAKRKTKYESAGVGCLIQGVGLLLLIWFPIGTVLGLMLLVYGSQKARFYVCGNCGNRLADKHVTMCPTCRARVE